MTGTTDTLVEAVLARKVEAAFVADCVTATEVQSMPAYEEEIVLLAPKSHPPITKARDVVADTIIAFPSGCAYRRRLQTWLANGRIVPERVLELSSYHAIVACVASGTGIAVAPKSVVETAKRMEDVAIYALQGKKNLAMTSLIWKKGEVSLALKAFQMLVAAPRKRPHRLRDVHPLVVTQSR
jgi:DNA-binding transcriptional LysR family regulator